VIFLTFLFFYMVVLMFIKWFKYYATNDGKLIYFTIIEKVYYRLRSQLNIIKHLKRHII